MNLLYFTHSLKPLTLKVFLYTAVRGLHYMKSFYIKRIIGVNLRFLLPISLRQSVLPSYVDQDSVGSALI